MQVSHETIYRSLFVQTRGALKKELMAHLRTARQMRQAKGGAPFSLRNADHGPEQGHGNRGRRAQQARAQITCGAAPIVDMGSGQGDGHKTVATNVQV